MRIAIVRLSAIGDIIQSMIVVQFIKERYQNCEIHWFVDTKFYDLVHEGFSIDKTIPISLSAIKKSKNPFALINLFINLRKLKEYDYVFDLQGLIKSALISKFIPSSYTVGFSKDSIRESFAACFYNLTHQIPYEENVVERYVELVNKTLDLNVSKNDILRKNKLFKTNNLNKKSRLRVIFISGASFKSKIYPLKKYELLVNNIDADFLCLWGSDSELIESNDFAKNNFKVMVSKKTTLNDLIQIINSADLVIGGDTGPTHLAWALNIPSITLFGSTSGLRNMFETKINLKIESNSEVSCKKINKKDFSISEIDPEQILEKARILLEI